MMTKKEKDAYWHMVSECLVAFHRLSRHDAAMKTEYHRTGIEGTEPEILSDIFYHNEPFDVACDITGEYIDIEKYFSDYEKLLEGTPVASSSNPPD